MTIFKNGDHVKATNGKSTLIGEYRGELLGDEYFDIKFADAYEFAQIRRDLWTLELIEPTIEEKLNALPIGSRFRTDNFEFIKVNATGYIETDEEKFKAAAKFIPDSPFLTAEHFTSPLEFQGVDYE